MILTKRQRSCLEWVEVLNNHYPPGRHIPYYHQYTTGPRGTLVKILDPRVTAALYRKGLIKKLVPVRPGIEADFYPILTDLGKKVIDRYL